eukprot:14876189-Alexandrium_andersonii.AAC.1
MAVDHSTLRRRAGARGARSLNSAGPGTASRMFPRALGVCVCVVCASCRRGAESNLVTERAGRRAGGASWGR